MATLNWDWNLAITCQVKTNGDSQLALGLKLGINMSSENKWRSLTAPGIKNSNNTAKEKKWGLSTGHGTGK